MISYKQCEEMVGVRPEYPTKKYGYRAYKDGECKVFYTSKEANEFSNLVERFVVTGEEEFFNIFNRNVVYASPIYAQLYNAKGMRLMDNT